jgi:hypothetical protein
MKIKRAKGEECCLLSPLYGNPLLAGVCSLWKYSHAESLDTARTVIASRKEYARVIRSSLLMQFVAAGEEPTIHRCCMTDDDCDDFSAYSPDDVFVKTVLK